MIEFDSRICSNFSLATSKEWLETNGLGGYASSTIIGCNTRRYHGLLVAALNPPGGRTVLLSRFEEELLIDGRIYRICTNQYPGVVHPDGYRLQQSFALDPFPTFCYQAGPVKLEKRLFLPYGQNATVIGYRLLAPAKSAALCLRPLVAGRDFHHLNHQGAVKLKSEVQEHELLVSFDWGAQLHLYCDRGRFAASPEWYYNFEYAREKERGLDYREDLFSPGMLILPLTEETSWVVAADRPLTPEPEKWHEQELTRRRALQNIWPGERPEIQTLTATADSFMARRSARLWGIIAGYHWFEDWGRDAMISLPGICMATGKMIAARGILLSYAKACKDGMLPNRFVEADGHPEYNTVDAALWFVNAMNQFYDYGQQKFVEMHLLPVARQIVERYYRGTHYGIHADADGLIETGPEGAQLTWMDAKVGERVMTPRCGKPVEIQALWYNALRVLERFGDCQWREVADRAQQSFAKLFWNEPDGCLYDRVTSWGPDASIRPNQVLACALPYPILSEELGRQMMSVVERELLTPYGLRTLSPRDLHYHGRYEGNVLSRDEAYHQGTVWAWPLGPYISAYLRLHKNTPEAKAHCRKLLEALLGHLSEAGLGSISEIFDGDPPHAPRGCISQAWSVAELLRVWTLLTDKRPTVGK